METKTKGYSLFNLSQAYDLADRFNLALDQTEDIAKLFLVISQTMEVVSPCVSGVILGPEVGFEAVFRKDPKTGLVLSLEKQSSFFSVNEMPKFYEQWGIEQIRNNYGVGHLKLYYHPQEELATQKKQLAGELYDAAKYEGVDLIIELAMYQPEKTLSENESNDSFEETQLLAAKEFQAVCDLLVLEYPHSSLSCATLSAELDVPWLLADRLDDYTYFKECLRIAMENGAVGCQIDNVVWSGLPEVKLAQADQDSKDWQVLTKYIQTELRDRLIEITRIVDEIKMRVVK